MFLGALERAGDRPEHQELFACWMHEVVLRGNVARRESLARSVSRGGLAKAGHPLAVLPLALRPTEREAPSYMPLYGDKGLGRAIETLDERSDVRAHDPAAGRRRRGSRDAASRMRPSIERMTSAVRPWAEGKSGKVEAKVFTPRSAGLGVRVGSWLLRALPLESTTADARLDVSRTGPEGVFGPLFSAASNGGAYSSGLGGAYGRLAAWTSLGALVGAPAAAEHRRDRRARLFVARSSCSARPALGFTTSPGTSACSRCGPGGGIRRPCSRRPTTD